MNPYINWFKRLRDRDQIVAALIGGLFVLAAAVIARAPDIWSVIRSTDSAVQLVNITLTDSTVTVDQFDPFSPPLATPGPDAVYVNGQLLVGQGENPVVVLDVMVRNTGGKVAVLKTARFEVNEYYGIRYPCIGGVSLPISSNYDLTLPVPKKSFENPTGGGLTVEYFEDGGNINDVTVSQELKPDSADRFTITIGSDLRRQYLLEYHVYGLRLHLIYDEDDKIVSSGPIALALGTPLEEWGLVDEATAWW